MILGGCGAASWEEKQAESPAQLGDFSGMVLLVGKKNKQCWWFGRKMGRASGAIR
jgi:hypothetical protein